MLRLLLLPLLVLHRRPDLVLHNLLEPLIDLSPTVNAQSAVLLRDVVPQEHQVEDRRSDEAERGNDPDDQGEQHGAEDQRLLYVIIEQRFDVEKELFHAAVAVLRRAVDFDFGLHDGIKRHGVDVLSRPFRQDDSDGGLEGEVDEEGDVVGAFLALRQFGKDQESPPPLASHTLHVDGERVHVALGHAAPPKDTQGAEPFVKQQGEGEHDAGGEDPFTVFERDLRFDLRAPSVED